MVDNETFRQIALSFQGTEENPHFDRRAFKVSGKRIFASLLEEQNSANVLLPLSDQITFCSYDKNVVYPVPNKFGLQGWTTFDLTKVPEELIAEALYTAYNDVFKLKTKK